MLFALQQFIEGAIWLTLDHELSQLSSPLTYVYSAFSHVLWPSFVPMAVLLMEPPGWRRLALRVCVAAGTVVSAWLAYTMSEYGVVSRVSGRHIEYITPHFLGVATMTMYLLSTGASQLLSTHGAVKAFGLLALLSFGAAYVAYNTWFISVWCYFAGALSAVVWLHFHSQPARISGMRPRWR